MSKKHLNHRPLTNKLYYHCTTINIRKMLTSGTGALVKEANMIKLS